MKMEKEYFVYKAIFDLKMDMEEGLQADWNKKTSHNDEYWIEQKITIINPSVLLLCGVGGACNFNKWG